MQIYRTKEGRRLQVPRQLIAPPSAPLGLRHGIAVCGAGAEAVRAGELMTYGDSRVDSYRQFGASMGRILKGAKPSEVPVIQPTKFELIINLKTAKALGLTISKEILLLADEVIE